MESIPTKDSQYVLDLASALHADWQQKYRRDNPTETTRFKTLKEGKWVNGTDGENTVDILNTDYTDLPTYWQKENLEAARVAMDLVMQRLKGSAEDNNPAALAYDTKWIEEAADKVHQEWSKRNSWDTKAKIAYADLPQVEKDKDISHIHMAIGILQKR